MALKQMEDWYNSMSVAERKAYNSSAKVKPVQFSTVGTSHVETILALLDEIDQNTRKITGIIREHGVMTDE